MSTFGATSRCRPNTGRRKTHKSKRSNKFDKFHKFSVPTHKNNKNIEAKYTDFHARGFLDIGKWKIRLVLGYILIYLS